MATMRQLVTVFVEVDQLSRQLQVHHQRQVARQLPHRELSSPPESLDTPAAEVFEAQPGRGIEQLRLVDVDAGDGAPDERRRQLANERLNFGQLRHAPATRAPAASCPPSSGRAS